MAHDLLLLPENVATAGGGRAGHQDDGASDGRRTVVSGRPAAAAVAVDVELKEEEEERRTKGERGQRGEDVEINERDCD